MFLLKLIYQRNVYIPAGVSLRKKYGMEGLRMCPVYIFMYIREYIYVYLYTHICIRLYSLLYDLCLHSQPWLKTSRDASCIIMVLVIVGNNNK